MILNTPSFLTLLSLSSLAVEAAPVSPRRKDASTEPALSVDPATLKPASFEKSVRSNANEGFTIMISKPGVPYLHLQPVKVTKDNELVVNGDYHATDVEAFIDSSHNLVTNKQDTGVIVADNSALKLAPAANDKPAAAAAGPAPASKGSKGISSTNLTNMGNAQRPSNPGKNAKGAGQFAKGAGRRIIYDNNPSSVPNKPSGNNKPKDDGDDSAPAPVVATDSSAWSVKEGDCLELNNQSLAWACPQPHTEMYKVFWTSSKPAQQTGCMKVDLVISTKDAPKKPDYLVKRSGPYMLII